jgi:hypothetical protein
MDRLKDGLGKAGQRGLQMRRPVQSTKVLLGTFEVTS